MNEAPRRRADVTTTEFFGPPSMNGVVITEYSSQWPQRYAEHAERITGALGELPHEVHHIGSTSVPGLGAKPIIDVLITVPDITAEEDYLAPLLAAGYELRVREPGHRLVRPPTLDAHLHILEPDDPAASDYLLLRDRLRTDDADRALYERTKRELATHEWADMNEYADAKTEVIEAIKDRARSGLVSDGRVVP